MISPTIGRVVWYWPTAEQTGQPWAALVTYVHSDRMINVGGWDANGNPVRATSIALLQDDDEPKGPHCQWMPYQKGQAAKTEALEKAALYTPEESDAIAGVMGSGSR